MGKGGFVNDIVDTGGEYEAEILLYVSICFGGEQLGATNVWVFIWKEKGLWDEA